jgi:prepilin-type N-terminal cleavage/methylation domain-containing protein
MFKLNSRLKKYTRHFSHGNQRGVSLIEVTISILVAGIVVAGILGAIRNASYTLVSVDEKETAKNIAESQMEYVKNQVYSTTGYSPDAVPEEYADYEISIDTDNISGRDNYIQKITITVEHRNNEVMRLMGYKTK